MLMLCMGVFYIPALASETEDIDQEEVVDVVEEIVNEVIESMTDEPDADLDDEAEAEIIITVSAIPDGTGLRPFTPPGTGTVIDNATDEDGKEFYTIGTMDGNVFYLIIDRARAADNVYFLSTVTEQDLISLAEENGRTITGNPGAIPSPDQPSEGEDGDESPETTIEDGDTNGSSNITLYLVIIAVAGVGGAAYYFKVVKGKKNSGSSDIYDDDDYDNDDEDDGFNRYENNSEHSDMHDDDYGYEPDDGSDR
jgi:hypothetical protein